MAIGRHVTKFDMNLTQRVQPKKSMDGAMSIPAANEHANSLTKEIPLRSGGRPVAPGRCTPRGFAYQKCVSARWSAPLWVAKMRFAVLTINRGC